MYKSGITHGIFSNIFKSKTKTIVSTQMGDFTLTYSKRNKNIWTNNNGDILLSIGGTEKQPDPIQINFLKNINVEVQKLDDKITKRFIKEFKDADLETNFSDWKQRFKIVATEIMLIFQNETYWNITFEELKEPFAHFTLYIEGTKTTDFSIDT